mgnify:CR=1 FL=1
MKKLFFTLFLVIIAASQLYCQVLESPSSFNNNVGNTDFQNDNVLSAHNMISVHLPTLLRLKSRTDQCIAAPVETPTRTTPYQ